MTKIQDIVPISISSAPRSKQKSIHSESSIPDSKIALRIKQDDLVMNIYNGCDKYILYTVLKEVISHAD